MSTFGGPDPTQNPYGTGGNSPDPFAQQWPNSGGPGLPGSAGGPQVPATRGGLDLAVGGLLMLLAVLFVVGSLLNLAEFRGNGNPSVGLDAFHSKWQAWSLTVDGTTDSSGDTQQLLGIPMIVAAVMGVVGAVPLLTGVASRRRGAHGIAVAAASLALGLTAAVVADVVSAFISSDSTVTTTLGPGFWIFAVCLPVSAVALAGVVVTGAATRPGAPRDGYGRPLSRKAGGFDIVAGLLLIPLAALMVLATCFEQTAGVTLWSAWNDKFQISGVPLVAGAAGALIAAVLSFVGRGRMPATGCAAGLFASGLLLSLDTVDLEMSGPVRIADFHVGAWLLFAATIVALIATVLAVASTAAKPGYRTPYTPVAQRYPGWVPPAQQAMPAPQGWPQPQPPQGFTPPARGWAPPPQ